MNNQIKPSLIGFFSLISGMCVAILLLFSSCKVSQYNMLGSYLDSSKTVQLSSYPFTYQEPTIRKYDIVRVKFAGKNPNVANQLNGSSVADGLETQVKATDGPVISGQQVDGEGNLQFPIIGKVKAEGLTKEELRLKLLELIAPILQNPFVLVDLPKRGITILGEVKSPSTIVFGKERANIFETLAQVGYTTDFADLSKVKVYREKADGSRYLAHLNLNDSSFLRSEFFYPQPDDVIYVPAVESKSLKNFGQTYAPFATIILALSTIFITIFR